MENTPHTSEEPPSEPLIISGESNKIFITSDCSNNISDSSNKNNCISSENFTSIINNETDKETSDNILKSNQENINLNSKENVACVIISKNEISNNNSSTDFVENKSDIIEEKNLPYIGIVTNEDMIKLYDSKISSLETPSSSIDAIFINNVLENLHCGENDLKPVIAVEDSKLKSTADLLAILEGNNENSATELENDKKYLPNFEAKNGVNRNVKKRFRNIVMDPALESELALKQLEEMPSGRHKQTKNLNKSIDIPSVTIPAKIKRFVIKKDTLIENDKCTSKNFIIPKKVAINKISKVKTTDISFITEDWTDDEIAEKTSENNSSISNKKIINVNQALHENEIKKQAESIANRRVSRIIKKKVIWDPDNPDTFQYASSSIKKNSQIDNEDTQKEYEKSCVDISEKQNIRISPSKKKKMTEVDKLLMDEGAVNMIYQLERSNNNVNVPELVLKPNKRSMISISKERRNLMHKTNVIKNAVFSIANLNNVNKNIKVFRFRKDSNKISNTPDKVSPIIDTQSSCISEPIVSIPLLNESCIIRRHSSSSFSSDCISPRPQSPPDTFNFNSSKVNTNDTELNIPDNKDKGFKRKRSSRDELKESFNSNNLDSNNISYNYLELKHLDKIINIIIKLPENFEFNNEILKEFRSAINSLKKPDPFVLLLTFENNSMCGNLNLSTLLNSNLEERKSHVTCLLSLIRGLIMDICNLKNAFVIGIDGPCEGFGVSLLPLADLVIASDRATFCTSSSSRKYLPPEGLSLLSLDQNIPSQSLRDMILCRRKLTASEALQKGLIAHIAKKESFNEELFEIVKDITQYPSQIFEISKSIMRHKEFLHIEESLKKECNALFKLWCSEEGQEIIKNIYNL